jgi:hypothetical protein
MLLARLGFGCTFLVAAASKIIDSDRFAQQILKYEIVGPQAAALLGATLPWMEFVIGSCLVSTIGPKGAWLGTILLLATFTAARISVLHRGMSIDCGCGVINTTITPLSVVISTLCLLAAIAAYIATVRAAAQATVRPRALTHDPSSPPQRLQPAGVSSCA